MSFSVDQFMQVKCKFTLTSETESAESINTNNEQIRLCKFVHLDTNNRSTLIVMVCSNESSNNHILAYYVEQPQSQSQLSPGNFNRTGTINLDNADNQPNPPKSVSRLPDSKNMTPARPNRTTTNRTLLPDSLSPAGHQRKSRLKPTVIIKQIYYHNYNEDIVSICLNQSGTKLVLINASSTIYVIPIKNILLNLHSQQLRSSHRRSMYFYDASILKPSSRAYKWSLIDPVDAVYWDSSYEDRDRSILIVACREGQLTYIDLDEKREICTTSVGEPIKSIDIICDGQSRSLLITCASFNQYRQVLKAEDDNQLDSRQEDTTSHVQTRTRTSFISFSKTQLIRLLMSGTERPASISTESRNNDAEYLCASKPILIQPPGSSSQPYQRSSARVIHRVFSPSANHLGAQSTLNLSDARDRPVTLMVYQSPDLIGLVDVLGYSSSQQFKYQLNQSPPQAYNQSNNVRDSRLVRFYSSKNYATQPNRPQIVCKLDLLDSDELITNLILTERFIALTTDKERCIIISRNCCRLRTSPVISPQAQRLDYMDPLVKEISFNHEEKIMTIIKSPTSNDLDNIIDSFLLVTTRSIYSIEARSSCRELFINMLDSDLAIKRALLMPKPRVDHRPTSSSINLECIVNASEKPVHRTSTLDFHRVATDTSCDTQRSAESDLLINNFLQHHEVYEKICHDSLAFSALFKIELSSLYEAYGDRLLQRGSLNLANRFFQMASFDHLKILGKYIRIGNYAGAINYARDVLCDGKDFRKVMTQSKKVEIAKVAFKCLLATGANGMLFSGEQKQIAEDIFTEFLIACLDESADDSCRLWFSYINFYLNYVGSLDQLQQDILRIVETIGDCRLAISFYKAIHRDEMFATGASMTHGGPCAKKTVHLTNNGFLSSKPSPDTTTHWREAMIKNTALEAMDQIFNLAHLFKNEFLMKLLAITLDLLPQSMDLDALGSATMC